MRIAIISSRYAPDVVGGAEKVVQVLAEGLVERGCQVDVLTLAADGRPRTDRVNGVEVGRVHPRNLYPPAKQGRPSIVRAMWHILDSYNPLAAKDVREWLQKIRPDVVNTHVIAGFSVSVWKSIKALGMPLIHTVHDLYMLCPRTTMFRDGRLCQKQCISCRFFSLPRLRAARHIDTVVGVSRFVLEHHSKYAAFPTQNRIVIYNGIDLREHHLPREKHIQDKARPFRFGFLGKINESKGIRLLIEAFLQLEPGQAELWIAGKGVDAYERQLKALTGHRPDVHWLGFVDPAQLLGNVEVLVFPSLWYEPAGVSIVEAYSFGVPVIGSRRGGTVELISPDAGWVFEPDQPGSLVRLMQEAIQNRTSLALLSTNALRHVRRFSSSQMVSAYLKEYENLLRTI